MFCDGKRISLKEWKDSLHTTKQKASLKTGLSSFAYEISLNHTIVDT